MKSRLFIVGWAIAVLVIVLALPVLHAANLNPNPVHSAVGPESITVFCYHRILTKPLSPYDLTPLQLEAHLKYLQEHDYHPITALQLIEAQKNPALLPTKPIVLSFDDGHPSHYTQVFPLLKKYKFVATFFVYPVGIAEKNDGRLTWGQLNEMAKAGMDIESHTIDHPFLTTHAPGQTEAQYMHWLEYQIKDSKTIIEQKLNRPVTLLAYPYGWFNQVTEDEAVKDGYQGLFTTNWGNIDLKTNPLRINRRVMENTFDVPRVEQFLNMKPLHLEIIGPVDNSILSQIPFIQFKLVEPGLQNVEIQVRSYRLKLDPDLKGIYNFNAMQSLKPGYCMIIIKAYDADKRLYEASWGFDYEPVGVEPKVSSKPELTKTIPKIEPKATPVPGSK